MKRIYKYARLQLALFFTIPFLRIIEYAYLNANISLPTSVIGDEIWGLLYDISFFAIYSIATLILFLIISLISESLASIVQKTLNTISLVSISSLLIFFAQRGSALDQELVQQSIKESLLVVQNSGSLSLVNILILFLPVLIYLSFDWLISKKMRRQRSLSLILFTLYLAIGITNNIFGAKNYKTYRIQYQLKANKLSFFLHKVIEYKYFSNNELLTKSHISHYQDHVGFEFVSSEFPLLHKNQMNDVLGPFFNQSDQKPNLVYIIVESLSSSMNGSASDYSGMITPFFDSLCAQGLYWSNCLSSSAISFEILPTLVASAPYGKVGFNTIPNLPHHQSIIKILNKAQYYSAFISGSPIYFANQGGLMRAQNTQFIINKFDKKYQRIDNSEKWSWGYSDDVLFRQGLDFVDSLFTPPYINFYVTITTHPPYIFNNSDQYQKEFLNRLSSANLSSKERDFFERNKIMFASFMSFDNELKWFMDEYKKRPEYENTIFIITGDHQGYYEPKNPANHFRVPLVIFSPLIKKPVSFKSVVLQAEITPTIINYLAKNYGVEAPKYVSWMANDMDTVKAFRNKNTYPFIYGNKEIIDIIHNNYYLNGGDLYKLSGPELDLDSITNDSVKTLMNSLLTEFKMINQYVCFDDKIIPDTLYESEFRFDSLLYSFVDTTARLTDETFPFGTKYVFSNDSSLIKFNISFKLKIPEAHYDDLPLLIVSVENPGQKEKIFYDSKELSFLTDKDLTPNTLLNLSVSDIMDLSKIPITDKTIIKVYLYNSHKLDIFYSNFKLSIYQ